MNVFPPGWMNHSDPWRDAINIKFGFSRPDVPKYLAAEIRNSYHPHKSNRQAIIDVCTNYVASRFGDIHSRTDVVSVLNELADLGIHVKGEGVKYVSVSTKGVEKNIRLKGAIYDKRNYDHRGFKYSHEREDIQQFRNSEEEYRGCCDKADVARQARARGNRKRFKSDFEDDHTLFDAEAVVAINARKAEENGKSKQKASSHEPSSTEQNSAATDNSKQASLDSGDSDCSQLISLDDDSFSEITLGNNPSTIKEKIKHETSKYFQRLGVTFKFFAEYFIPVVSRLVQLNNRENDEHRANAEKHTERAGRPSSSIKESKRIAENARARATKIEEGCCDDLRRVSRKLVRLLARKNYTDKPEMIRKPDMFS